MKLPILGLCLGLIVFFAGCKGKTDKQYPQALNERLVIDVVKLDNQAIQSYVRMKWFAGCLEKSLSRLEKVNGLEEMPFDWAKVYNLPKPLSDKPTIQRYEPFYLPCPNIPDIPKNAIPVQLYSDPEILASHIELQMNRGGCYIGMEEYIRHTEKRLKRLEDYFDKQNQNVSKYQYSESTINELPALDIVAVIFSDSNDLKTAKNIMLIGDPDEVRGILGWNITFTKICLNSCYANNLASSWVNKITDDFKNAKKINREYSGKARAFFITENKGYMIKITADDEAVYGPNYQSEQLWKDIQEIGLDIRNL